MQLKNKCILIISNEPWGDIWYSKHNWAFELSKDNLVYFVNPPKRWKLSHLFNKGIKVDNYTESLKIFNYNNRLPFTRFDFLFKLNENIIYKTLNAFFKDKKNIIFWSFDPYRLINPKKINKLFSIHFIADKYLMKREVELVNNSDYHITVSKELSDILKIKKTLILSHGISETEFVVEKTVLEDDYILYVGGIDYRLDYLLIKELLIKFSNEKFLFIGKLANVENEDFRNIFLEKKYKNLKHLPPIHFKELKNYIAKSKLCLAPMKLDVQGNNINHHKLLQYLALGKPILSAKFKDYSKNELLLEYSDKKEAIDKLNKLIENAEDVGIKQKRINFAKQFLYKNLIKEVESFID